MAVIQIMNHVLFISITNQWDTVLIQCLPQEKTQPSHTPQSYWLHTSQIKFSPFKSVKFPVCGGERYLKKKQLQSRF